MDKAELRHAIQDCLDDYGVDGLMPNDDYSALTDALVDTVWALLNATVGEAK